jgi:hypothetical protein
MRKVVFVNDIARQPAMVSHGESLPLSPGAYLAASLPARCRPGSGARPRKQQARMLDKRCKLAAELGRMPRAQIYLVEHPVQAEPHGLVGRAASQVILKMHFDPLHYLPPNCGLCLAPDPEVSWQLKVIPFREQMYRGLRDTGRR